MGYFEPVAYFTHLTKFYTIIRHSQHQFFVPTMSIQVSILKYILTESGGSILQCKSRNLKKNSLVAWSHSKWLNCKDTCKSRVGQNYKRQKKFTKHQNSLGNIIDTCFGRGRCWQRQRWRNSL